jgi:acyl-CoA synthetase (NDP forming)
MNQARSLFEPDTVVLIGSTRMKQRVGMSSPQLFKGVVYNMTRYFEGTTYVLDLEGKEGYRSLEELPKTPDLAVTMLPPDQSLHQLEECAKIGVKAVVVITGGYKDPQRQRLRRLRNDYGIRILGPNSIMGVINTTNGLNTTFERDLMPPKGGISVIAQSGGIGACILDWACHYGTGIGKFAFTGDKIDFDDIDLLRYFGADPETRVISLYVEGVQRGQEFIKTARKIVEEKPILALKGGVTEEAAKRARSHTTSMAGSDAVFDAAFRKAGIIRVKDIEELLNAAIALAKQPPLKGDNIAIVSNVGGPAILAADAVVRNGLQLAQLSAKTRREIERHYPGVEVINPIDLIADARAKRYAAVLDTVLSDPSVDGVMIINMLKSCFFEPEDALAIIGVSKKHSGKPVVDVAGGGEDFGLVHSVLGDSSVPLYNLPEKAASVLRVLRAYSRMLASRV